MKAKILKILSPFLALSFNILVAAPYSLADPNPRFSGQSYRVEKFYQHPGRAGHAVQLLARMKSMPCMLYDLFKNCESSFNDRVSSMDIANGRMYLLYADHNYEGSCIALYAERPTAASRDNWQKFGYINLADVGFNDRVSSYKADLVPNNHTRCKRIPLMAASDSSKRYIPKTE